MELRFYNKQEDTYETREIGYDPSVTKLRYNGDFFKDVERTKKGFNIIKEATKRSAVGALIIGAILGGIHLTGLYNLPLLQSIAISSPVIAVSSVLAADKQRLKYQLANERLSGLVHQLDAERVCVWVRHLERHQVTSELEGRISQDHKLILRDIAVFGYNDDVHTLRETTSIKYEFPEKKRYVYKSLELKKRDVNRKSV